MTAILKVDEIQDTSGNLIIKEDSNTITVGASGDTVDVPGTEVKTNKISPTSGTGLQLGDSGDTITIPSGATITNSGTATGFGKVLQVVYVITSTEVSVTSSTWTDLVSTTITPASTSNKVLALCSIGGLARHSGDTELQLRLRRDSTTVGETKGLNDGASGFISTAGCSINELDAPSSTSSLTYKLQLNNRDGNGTVMASVNGADTSITLLEIKG